MPRQTRNHLWYHADEGQLPTAARAPWTQTGTDGLAIVGSELRVISSAAANVLWRPLGPQDVRTSAPRATDRATLQWQVRGLTFTPGGWASAASPIVAGIDDGARPLGVSIGSRLQWVNPYTGVVLGLIADNFPWFREHTFRLVKERGARFTLWVDGRKRASIPFGACPAVLSSEGTPPRFFWGHLDDSGTATTFWTSVEAGLDTSIAPQWITDRLRLAAPRPIQDAWNERSRALYRSIAGMWQGVVEAMEELQELPLAARDTVEELSAEGDRDPQGEGWTVVSTTSPSFALVRERIRYGDPEHPDVFRLQAPFETLPAASQSDVEVRIRCRFTLRSNDLQSDASNRAGPFLLVENTHRRIRADLVRGTGDDADRYGWVLTEQTSTTPSAAITERGQWHWFVDPFQPHEVELQVLGRDVVVLLVDGHFVDCIAYADWTDTTSLSAGLVATAGVWGHAGLSAGVDLEDLVASVRYTDLSRRPFFYQRIAERSIFRGGRERNDLLDTLLRNRRGLWALRGTLKGLVLEVQRLSGSRSSNVVRSSRPAGWYLDETCPPAQAVYLDATGVFTTNEIELSFQATTFTLLELARLVVQYLAPASLVELPTTVWAKATLTAPAASTSVTELTVTDTSVFTVGDAVEVRNAAHTLTEQTTVVAIVSATVLQVDRLTQTFTTNDVLRKQIL